MLFTVIDAVVEPSNVVAVLIGSAVTNFSFYLNLKLRRNENPISFKIFNFKH